MTSPETKHAHLLVCGHTITTDYPARKITGNTARCPECGRKRQYADRARPTVRTRDLHIRVPESLWHMVMRQAADDRRTISAQVIKILGEATGWEWGQNESYGPIELVHPGARNYLANRQSG